MQRANLTGGVMGSFSLGHYPVQNTVFTTSYQQKKRDKMSIAFIDVSDILRGFIQ